jgi:CRP/FNR family transcriptional regulator, cyclic AMP receptor protein
VEAKVSRTSKIKSKKKPVPAPITAFDAQAFLDSAGTARKVSEFQRKQIIFSQGDDSQHVMYIQKGGVKLSVVNDVGREAVVAILGPGDFLGEGYLSGQLLRIGTATAITPTTLLLIEKQE